MELTLDARLDDLATIREFVESACKSYNIDSEVISDITLSVDEAVTNIIEHGYNGGPGPLEIEIELQGSDAVIQIRDSASVFNPLGHKDVDLDSPLQKLNPGGYGIFLIQKIMDEVEHLISPNGGNILRLVKKDAVAVA